jgi:hypothetical protein
MEDALRDADRALQEMIALSFVVGKSSTGENR